MSEKTGNLTIPWDELHGFAELFHMKNTSHIDLSVIIVSFNTSQLTLNCLKSLTYSLKKEKNLRSEIIVVDNASSDDSTRVIESFLQHSAVPIRLIKNKKNTGFGVANNQGVAKANGAYILLLNSDTLIEHVDIASLLDYMGKNEKIGILTVSVRFPHGQIDPASHRGFPTIWRTFCYYSGLEQLTAKTPLNRFFGGYHLTYFDLTKTHEIDSPSGAFFLMSSKLYRKVSGFDESFFMYGEDLDLAYRVKKLGFSIVYYPQYVILHLKHQSGLHADKKTQDLTRFHFYNAMKIFYKKHYAQHHLNLVNNIIYALIDLKTKL